MEGRQQNSLECWLLFADAEEAARDSADVCLEAKGHVVPEPHSRDKKDMSHSWDWQRALGTLTACYFLLDLPCLFLLLNSQHCP